MSGQQNPAIAAICAATLRAHEDTIVALLKDGGKPVGIGIAEGYLPLLVRYTFEDAAAKGLRKLATDHRPLLQEHFTALEVTQREAMLILHGDTGSGKTIFARHLALHLAGEFLAHPRFNVAALTRAVPRNDHDAPLDEAWTGAAPVPLYVHARPGASLAALLDEAHPGVAALPARLPDQPILLIVDGLGQADIAGSALLHEAAALAARHGKLRVLALAATEAVQHWTVPDAFRHPALLPLLAAQRTAYLCHAARWRHRPAPAAARDWDTPALFMLSLAVPASPASALELANQWLARLDTQGDSGAVVRQPFFQRLLAALELASLSPDAIAAIAHADMPHWSAPLRALAAHWAGSPKLPPLLRALLAAGASHERQAAALLVADIIADVPDAQRVTLDEPQHTVIRGALLQLITEASAPPPVRKKAGHHLAVYGDPRDLEELIAIEGGSFIMGSALHPNSSPAHPVRVASFRIGRYPVTNSLYARFADETRRHWHSAQGRDPGRANSPATDLSWHDARAYCAWLTTRWRGAGIIAPNEVARLPTEAEWEHAARGKQDGADGAIVYPWQGAWDRTRGNTEDNGFNEPCPVGLFPHGRSVFGCDDMAGQVWEWTSTVWGADMATPSWRYPYADDGREDPGAPPGQRRVLRGGCFSSGPEKACCTYRGSLEPAGFWRGNGFRIAICQEASSWP